MGRGSIHEQFSLFFPLSCDKGNVSGISTSFPALSQSQGQVIHALLTRPPLKLYFASFHTASVRLACVKHAASVRPEPGSNSPKKGMGTHLSDMIPSGVGGMSPIFYEKLFQALFIDVFRLSYSNLELRASYLEKRGLAFFLIHHFCFHCLVFKDRFSLRRFLAGKKLFYSFFASRSTGVFYQLSDRATLLLFALSLSSRQEVILLFFRSPVNR